VLRHRGFALQYRSTRRSRSRPRSLVVFFFQEFSLMSASSRISAKRANKVLEDWERELPEVDAAIQRIRARLLLIGTHISRDNDRIARGFGITGPEMRILFALRRHGPPYQMRPTDLFESLLVPSSSMTRQLDRLEEEGFLKRLPDPDDRRGSLVGLTRGGVKAANRALAEALDKSDVTEALQRLSAHDRTSLDSLLEGLLNRFEGSVQGVPSDQQSVATSRKGARRGPAVD
jgi:DNA-binding MarR family transcriptional regulator